LRNEPNLGRLTTGTGVFCETNPISRRAPRTGSFLRNEPNLGRLTTVPAFFCETNPISRRAAHTGSFLRNEPNSGETTKLQIVKDLSPPRE
jgi:hypothetical protein